MLSPSGSAARTRSGGPIKRRAGQPIGGDHLDAVGRIERGLSGGVVHRSRGTAMVAAAYAAEVESSWSWVSIQISPSAFSSSYQRE